MDDKQIGSLARAVAALRPDWPAASLASFLRARLLDRTAPAGELEARTYAEVALALAWVALCTKTQTPALVTRAGPWWKLAGGTDEPKRWAPPRREEECPTHPGEWGGEQCRACAADRLVDQQATAPTQADLDDRGAGTDLHAEQLREAREAIRAARRPARTADDLEPSEPGPPEPVSGPAGATAR
jgi:hypothetical protein